jgi:hypothetical protein
MVLLSVEPTPGSTVDEATDVTGAGVVSETMGLGADSVVDADAGLTGTSSVVTVFRPVVACDSGEVVVDTGCDALEPAALSALSTEIASSAHRTDHA